MSLASPGHPPLPRVGRGRLFSAGTLALMAASAALFLAAQENPPAPEAVAPAAIFTSVPKSSAPPDLIILATGDVSGLVEPCG